MLRQSLPFIIALVALVPLTRLIVVLTIGSTASIVPLTIAAIPFFAHVTETALREVGRGLVQAAQAVGSSNGHIIWKMAAAGSADVAGSRPDDHDHCAAGLLGADGHSGWCGLGNVAIRYGYQRV